MEGWQIDLLKVVVPAVIAGVGGWWAHWSFAKKKRLEAELLEQERQAEYDAFKRKRKLVGAGEVERMERADKLTDLLIKQKTHQITREEFNAFKGDLIAGRTPGTTKKRIVDAAASGESPKLVWRVADGITAHSGEGPRVSLDQFIKGAPFDPRLTEERRQLLARRLFAVLEEKGPNGLPVGYDSDGRKVEWMIGDAEEGAEGAEPFWPIVLFRSEMEIYIALEELFHKVWWNRHRIWVEKIASGEEPLTEEQKPILEAAKANAKWIEEKYGRENLGWDDFEWGMVNGKLSALRWVTGSEWDFLDT
jgi:hypothetical protein